jgi:predicted 3-demethylubiquinone-9 3-methyltransferase (glyoxalase superfamily)
MQNIIPFLWFDDNAEEAVNYYVSVFSDSPLTGKDSKVLETSRYDKASASASGRPEGSVMVMSFLLDGQEFNALNGGPMFKFNEAVSFVVRCENQEEIDYFWAKLSAVPEAEQCEFPGK